MVKNLFLHCFILFFFIACGTEAQEDIKENPDIVDTCETINHNNPSGEDLDESQELVALENVYGKFEQYVREKSATGLNSIFLHNFIPLYITGKETSGIKDIVLNGPQFLNYIVGNNNPHELRITNTDFTIFKGAAVSWANYEEVINNSTVGTGIDLFFYINSEEGWKIATTNNTYILTGDNTDYASKNPMLSIPKENLDKMVDAFNGKDKTAFLSTFKNGSPLFLLSSVLTETFSNNKHTATAFIDCALSGENSYALSYSNESIEIKDQYLAEVITDYSILTGTTVLESGKMVLTMIATPYNGWKISAAALTY